jgi:GTPase involved in cell partitioning and DNA repair
MESNKRIIEKSDGIIFVCSFDNKESLNRIKYWHNLLNPYTDLTKKQIVIFVNKNDLEDEIEISDDDIKKISRELKSDYFMMSARTGKGVKKAFGTFAQRVITKTYNIQSKYDDLTTSKGINNNQNYFIL